MSYSQIHPAPGEKRDITRMTQGYLCIDFIKVVEVKQMPDTNVHILKQMAGTSYTHLILDYHLPLVSATKASKK
jgi:hypothetical protein